MANAALLLSALGIVCCGVLLVCIHTMYLAMPKVHEWEVCSNFPLFVTPR